MKTTTGRADTHSADGGKARPGQREAPPTVRSPASRSVLRLQRRAGNAAVPPDFADLTRLYRQIAGLKRWGRNVGIVKVRVP